MKYSKSFKMRKDYIWYILPLVIFEYNPYTFLESGIYNNSFTFGIKWLKYSIIYTIQESY